ncbi:MAG: hypothetical protein ACHQ51_04035 [Elusimicrobiota bacterium]
MRWPLHLTFNLCLIALVGGGLFVVVRSNTKAEEGERTSALGTLDGLIASWDAGGVPPERRVINLFVGGEPEDSLMDPPVPRVFWWPVKAWFHRDEAKAERAREIERLLGRERPLADWSSVGLTWAAERRARLQGLSRYVARAHQAKARLVIVAYDREAQAAVGAVRAAGESTSDLVLADKLIVLGASGDSYLALINQDDVDARGPDRIREKLLIWHRAGKGADPEGMEISFRNDAGRVVNGRLSGDAATAEGSMALVRALTSPEADMETLLIRGGQIPARTASPAPASASALPPARVAAGTPPSPVAPAAADNSLRRPAARAESAARAEESSASGGAAPEGDHPPVQFTCETNRRAAWSLWAYEPVYHLDRDYLERRYPEATGLPAHCDFVISCGLLSAQPIDESNYRFIIRRTTFIGRPAFITHLTDTAADGTKLDATSYVLNVEGEGAVFTSLTVGSKTDLGACPNTRLLPVFERIARTLHR